MKFGVREICDVVLRAKANQKIGDKIFYKNEPVLYFDTLKTSSMEGAATTVYAQGGRGNARLASWDGERTVTFTMEDALISPISFSILSGAGVIDATEQPIYQHITEQTDEVIIDSNGEVIITLSNKPVTADEKNKLNANEDYIYVMLLDSNGDVKSEPFIATLDTNDDENGVYKIKIASGDKVNVDSADTTASRLYNPNDKNGFKNGSIVLVDYYVAHEKNAQQIEITADKFGGTYYLEASTLFRDAATGKDMPAEFIIPKCKIQSNFTFTMASSGDPSTFTFTMDAFPDYTRFDKTKKVLAAIQIMSESSDEDVLRRASTAAGHTHQEDDNGIIVEGGYLNKTTPSEGI